MTVLNFPDTSGKPTDGSFIYVANGVIYTWDGDKWTSEGQGGNPPDVRTGNLQEVTDLGNTTTNGITTGTITAAGAILSGDATRTGAYSVLEASGIIESVPPSDSSRAFSVYSRDQKVRTVEVKGDGSITAAGDGNFEGNIYISGGADTPGADNYGLSLTAGGIKVRNDLTASSAYVFRAVNASGTTSEILADGSITAAGGETNIYADGTIEIGGNPNGSGNTGLSLATTGGLITRTSLNPSVKIFPPTGSTPSIVLNRDGSGSFDGAITTPSNYPGGSNSGGVKILPSGGAGIQAAGSSGFLWQGYTVGNAAQTSSITPDGDITASGRITSNTGVNVDATNGFVSTTDSGFHFRGRRSDGTHAMEITANGSATFASNINLGPNSGSVSQDKEGIGLGATGTVSTYVSSTSDGNSNAFAVLNTTAAGGGTVWSVKKNGTSSYAGTILFNLEADDDTKYTSTTDVDGESTLVYNGATLDVKDRLVKTDAALQALKTAAAAASDFTALKSAIATALAEI